jgi:histone demethylase
MVRCSHNFWFVCPQIEVFNILFIREQEKRHVVHCIDCARKQAPGLEGFVCLEEYRMEELCEVFDHFVLQPVVRQRCYFVLQ